MTALALSVFAAGAALTDLKCHKIYNLYLLPGLAAGLTIRLLTGGLQGLCEGLISFGCAFLVLLPVYAFKGIAAGDVKLVAAIGSFLQVRALLFVIGVAFVLTALYGVGRLIIKRQLKGQIHFAAPVFFSVVALQAGGLV